MRGIPAQGASVLLGAAVRAAVCSLVCVPNRSRLSGSCCCEHPAGVRGVVSGVSGLCGRLGEELRRRKLNAEMPFLGREFAGRSGVRASRKCVSVAERGEGVGQVGGAECGGIVGFRHIHCGAILWIENRHHMRILRGRHHECRGIGENLPADTGGRHQADAGEFSQQACEAIRSALPNSP